MLNAFEFAIGIFQALTNSHHTMVGEQESITSMHVRPQCIWQFCCGGCAIPCQWNRPESGDDFRGNAFLQRNTGGGKTRAVDRMRVDYGTDVRSLAIEKQMQRQLA